MIKKINYNYIFIILFIGIFNSCAHQDPITHIEPSNPWLSIEDAYFETETLPKLRFNVVINRRHPFSGECYLWVNVYKIRQEYTANG